MEHVSQSHSDLLHLLQKSLIEIHQSTSENALSQLIYFIELIEKHNEDRKLTPIADKDMMVVRHLLDSLTLVPHLKSKRILDVGTGAGLPGIPLAIVMQDKQFVLLDRNVKKVEFLRKAVEQLNLNNVQVVHEELADYQTDQKFDGVICRGFGEIGFLLKNIQSLVTADAQVLAMKNVYPHSEIEQIEMPFRLVDIHAIQVSQLEDKRHVMEVCLAA